jgi:hypothetical protein
MANTLLLLFAFVSQFAPQNTQPVLVARVIDVKYAGNYPGSSPSTIIYVSTLENCQMACSNYAGCRTVTFDPYSNKCGLFFDSPKSNCKPLPQGGVATTVTSNGNQVSTGK